MTTPETNNDAENDWPTTAELPMGPDVLANEIRRSLFKPNRRLKPGSAGAIVLARQNGKAGDQLREAYLSTRQPELSYQAGEHYQWGLDAAAGNPFWSARLHFDRAVLHHYTGVNGGYVSEDMWVDLDFAALNLAKVEERKLKRARDELGAAITDMIEAYRVAATAAEPFLEAQSATPEQRLFELGRNVIALNSFKDADTVEIPPAPTLVPWREPKHKGWDIGATESGLGVA